MAPSGPHDLQLWRAGEAFWPRLRGGMVFRFLGLRTGSTSSLRDGGPVLLPLTATKIVSSVVGITVGEPLLLLCNSSLSVRDVWATTGHAARGITAVTLRVTEALAVFALYGSLRSLVRFNCHSETTERR